MMSFWVVPCSSLLGGATPCSSAATMYSASSHAAVALIVIEVFISAERDAVHQGSHVAAVGHRNPDLAHLSASELVVGVISGLGGQVESDRQSRLPLREVAPV